MDTRVIETIGTISKEEILCSLSENLSNKAMILESKFPFPGYYHNHPAGITQKPKSLFFITKKKYDEELIIRFSKHVREDTSIVFDGAPGRVEVYNIPTHCIRIKNLESYQDINLLVEAFKKKGFEFQKYTKINDYNSVIKIQKFFEIIEIERGIYQDATQSSSYYFEIPELLTWKDFAKITMNIKHNIDHSRYDAALGTIYRGHQIVDMVRIFDSNCNDAILDKIRKAYLQYMTPV
jgi:hypothetical protein